MATDGGFLMSWPIWAEFREKSRPCLRGCLLQESWQLPLRTQFLSRNTDFRADTSLSS
jgi:hypothetical protein